MIQLMSNEFQSMDVVSSHELAMHLIYYMADKESLVYWSGNWLSELVHPGISCPPTWTILHAY
jgi:hypothetical protein